VPDPVRVAFGEWLAQQFFDRPRHADLVGRVVVVEDGLQPVELAGREPVAGGEQHRPVRPGRVDPAAAAAVLCTVEALAYVGDHVVGEPDQVPVVDCDLGVRQRGSSPTHNRAGGAGAARADTDGGAGDRRDPSPIGALAARAGRVEAVGPVADVVRRC